MNEIAEQIWAWDQERNERQGISRSHEDELASVYADRLVERLIEDDRQATFAALCEEWEANNG
jgi:hypothetical protein